MSLRLRFFLIAWPTVVVAVLLVALNVERWAGVELERVERTRETPVEEAARVDLARRLADRWREAGAAGLENAVAGEVGVTLVVVDAKGALVASNVANVQMTPLDAEPGGVVRLEWVHDGAGGRREARLLELGGTPLRDPDGTLRGYLYRPPGMEEPVPPVRVEWRTNLRRTLWWSVLVASVVAAGAAFLLAGPLVRPMQRLTEAASVLRGGGRPAPLPEEGAEELARLSRTFNAMAAELARAEQLKKNLVSDVAHELRTPLTNILGSIEALQDGLRAPDAAALASLREEAGLLAALVDDLQELSLAESGQLAFAMSSVDARAAAMSAVEAARATAGGVRLVPPAPEPPLYVRADARRLAQVLRNLLRNALAHTPPGGEVRVAVERVAGGAGATPPPGASPRAGAGATAPTGANVLITVTDTGSGIPAEHLPLIWERFHRVDPSRDRSSGGMGLGLALVKQLVERMGGTVGVESRVGAGSSFRVTFPAAPVDAPRGELPRRGPGDVRPRDERC